MGKTVFISYSHADKKWLDELTKFLSPWIRDKKMEVWEDRQILPGDKWDTQITKAIEGSKVAVLLVSQSFLASDYINKVELPMIVEKAAKKEVRIIWIPIGHSTYQQSPLMHYQAAHPVDKPLSDLSRSKREKAWVEIAQSIDNALAINSFANSLRIIDETTEPIEALLEQRPMRSRSAFTVQAEFAPQEDRISFTGSRATITYEDVQKLPDQDREYIADYEESLEKNYKRWQTVRKGLGDAGGAFDDEIKGQMSRIVKLICDDLNNILDFLQKMHKYELDDHYGRYRHLCSRL